MQPKVMSCQQPKGMFVGSGGRDAAELTLWRGSLGADSPQGVVAFRADAAYFRAVWDAWCGRRSGGLVAGCGAGTWRTGVGRSARIPGQHETLAAVES